MSTKLIQWSEIAISMKALGHKLVAPYKVNI